MLDINTCRGTETRTYYPVYLIEDVACVGFNNSVQGI